jgi:hypothetical protein
MSRYLVIFSTSEAKGLMVSGFSDMENLKKSDNFKIISRARAASEMVSALIELRLLNKKCGLI